MRVRVFVATAVVSAVVILANLLTKDHDAAPFEPGSRIAEAVPIAAWAEPEKDMAEFFPEADHFKIEKYTLSAKQGELAQRLGRRLEAGENLLTVHRVYKGPSFVGSVIVRRVKGEHGSIDVVLALCEDKRIRGIRMQRSREPDGIQAALTNPQWLAIMQGRATMTNWTETDMHGLPEAARPSAKAIIDGVNSALIQIAEVDADIERAHH